MNRRVKVGRATWIKVRTRSLPINKGRVHRVVGYRQEDSYYLDLHFFSPYDGSFGTVRCPLPDVSAQEFSLLFHLVCKLEVLHENTLADLYSSVIQMRSQDNDMRTEALYCVCRVLKCSPDAFTKIERAACQFSVPASPRCKLSPPIQNYIRAVAPKF